MLKLLKLCGTVEEEVYFVQNLENYQWLEVTVKSDNSEIIEYLKRMDRSLENISRGVFCMFVISVVIMFLILLIYWGG